MSGIKQTPVPCFKSVEEFKRGLKIKEQFGPVDLYPRDGCILLAQVETRINQLMGVADGTTVVYSSGMAAVCGAIDVALNGAVREKPVLVFSQGLYKQTRKYIEDYVGKRAIVHIFDSGSAEDVELVLGKLKPDVIVTETVSNHINAPVLDIPHLLDLTRSSLQASTLVIDNTLPLSTGLPLAAKLHRNDRVVVVESGTKSYTFNQELLGITHTKHSELSRALLKYRRTTGAIPNGAGLRRTLKLLPKTKKEFDQRNSRLFAHTEALANALYQAGFQVSHPAIPAHPNHKLYRRDFLVGGTPVFYIKSAADHYELAARLWRHPEVQQHVRLGQSFGFDETRMLIDENAGAVRLAGGSETDVDRLGPALVEAIKI